jgi:hypothetical protein
MCAYFANLECALDRIVSVPSTMQERTGAHLLSAYLMSAAIQPTHTSSEASQRSQTLEVPHVRLAAGRSADRAPPRGAGPPYLSTFVTPFRIVVSAETTSHSSPAGKRPVCLPERVSLACRFAPASAALRALTASGMYSVWRGKMSDDSPSASNPGTPPSRARPGGTRTRRGP